MPSSDIQTGQQTSDFTNATVSGNSDYQQGYQGKYMINLFRKTIDETGLGISVNKRNGVKSYQK